jgi:hypothetical protein
VEGLSGECRMKDEPPKTTIIRISNGSVLLTAKLAGNKTVRRYKDGWKMNVLQLNLQMLITMIRGEDGCVTRFNCKFNVTDGGKHCMGFVWAATRTEQHSWLGTRGSVNMPLRSGRTVLFRYWKKTSTLQ